MMDRSRIIARLADTITDLDDGRSKTDDAAAIANVPSDLAKLPMEIEQSAVWAERVPA